jgi:hypothetical protein
LRNHARNRRLMLVDVANGVIDGSFDVSELDSQDAEPAS